MWIKDADFCEGLLCTTGCRPYSGTMWLQVFLVIEHVPLQSDVVLLNTVGLQITGTQTLSLVSTLSAGGSFTMYSCWLIGAGDFLNNTERCELLVKHLERLSSSTGPSSHSRTHLQYSLTTFLPNYFQAFFFSLLNPSKDILSQ